MSHRLERRRDLMRRFCAPQPEGWLDVGIALAIAVGYLLLLLATLSDLGYARDEGFYFHAARSYQRWFQLLSSDLDAALASVDRHWAVNHEHPALIKSLFALSHMVLWDDAQLFAMEGTSFRFPAMLLSGLGVGLVYLWGARARGRLAGLVAAGSLAFMPRFFFHAHLACFDAPVVTMWTLCAYCYWRSVQRGGLAYVLATGVTFALALNTKHNAWFLPIVCLLHALALQLTGVARGIDRGRLRRRALATLVAMATLGPLLFYASWPWIWHDTVHRLEAYAKFHLRHVYYNMEFLGVNYWRPPMPRSYAFVMTAATVPVVTLVAFFTGLCASLRRDLSPLYRRLRGGSPVMRWSALHGSSDAATTLFWLAAIAVQYGAWLSPTTPIFGGTKHWMTAYPFLALFAGEGARCLVLAAHHRWPRSAVAPMLSGGWLEAIVTIALLAAPLAQALHVHPWGLSSYNVLVGGAAGGANLGLNRGFWGYTTGSVAHHLNEHAEDGARVYIHDTAAASWDMLKRDGRLRDDLVVAWDVGQADWALYHHEMHMSGVEYQAWVAFGSASPELVTGLDGVPVIWVYRRRPPP